MGNSQKDPQHQHLDLTPEQALFGPFESSSPSLDQPLDGMVATFHTNERPLLGLAGMLDWYFHGAISNFLRSGALSGAQGECAYLPITLPAITLPGRTYHILLIGAGSSSSPGTREPLNEKAFSILKNNLRSLKVSRIGLSRSDLGQSSPEAVFKMLKEAPAWVVR